MYVQTNGPLNLPVLTHLGSPPTCIDSSGTLPTCTDSSGTPPTCNDSSGTPPTCIDSSSSERPRHSAPYLCRVVSGSGMHKITVLLNVPISYFHIRCEGSEASMYISPHLLRVHNHLLPLVCIWSDTASRLSYLHSPTYSTHQNIHWRSYHLEQSSQLC